MSGQILAFRATLSLHDPVLSLFHIGLTPFLVMMYLFSRLEDGKSRKNTQSAAAGKNEISFEIQLIGSRCGPFTKAIDVLRRKLVDVTEMVDGDFPLKKALDAFSLAQKPGITKVLITP